MACPCSWGAAWGSGRPCWRREGRLLPAPARAAAPPGGGRRDRRGTADVPAPGGSSEGRPPTLEPGERSPLLRLPRGRLFLPGEVQHAWPGGTARPRSCGAARGKSPPLEPEEENLSSSFCECSCSSRWMAARSARKVSCPCSCGVGRRRSCPHRSRRRATPPPAPARADPPPGMRQKKHLMKALCQVCSPLPR